MIHPLCIFLVEQNDMDCTVLQNWQLANLTLNKLRTVQSNHGKIWATGPIIYWKLKWQLGPSPDSNPLSDEIWLRDVNVWHMPQIWSPSKRFHPSYYWTRTTEADIQPERFTASYYFYWCIKMFKIIIILATFTNLAVALPQSRPKEDNCYDLWWKSNTQLNHFDALKCIENK